MDINELTQKLVKIPSESGKEKEISDFIFNFLDGENLNPELIEVKKNRNNVICNVGSGSPKILMNSHMDTVDVGDREKWDLDPFLGKIIGNKLYGRGSCDMKAGLAIQLMTLLEISKMNVDATLSLHCVVDEEGISEGTNKLQKSGFMKNYDYGIISEPSILSGDSHISLIRGCRGRYGIEIITKGRGSHGAGVDNNVNVISDASKIIANLDKIKMKSHPEMGKGFLSVNKITSGTEYLSTPEKCVFRIDWSPVIGETTDYAYSQLKKLIESLKLKSDTIIKWMDRSTPFCEPCLTSKNEKITKTAEKIFSKYKMPVGNPVSSSTFDMSIIKNFSRIPCINVGPVGGNIHSNNEFVYLDSIKRCYEITKDIILELIQKR